MSIQMERKYNNQFYCSHQFRIKKMLHITPNIPRLGENAKHFNHISADPSAIEAVSRIPNPESLRSRD